MKRYPDVCPTCGRPLLGTPSVDTEADRLMLRRHFNREHRGLVGIASRLSDFRRFEFALLGPKAGTERWYIAAFDWPFEIVSIDPSDYRITFDDKVQKEIP